MFRQDSYDTLLPVLSKGSNFEESQFGVWVYLANSALSSDPIIRKNRLKNIYGFGYINLLTDTVTIRRSVIDIVFIKATRGDEIVHAFCTVDRKTQRLIDGYIYNPSINSIQKIYYNRFEAPKGWEVDLSNNESAKGELEFKLGCFRINNFGKIDFIEEIPYDKKIYDHLSMTQKYTGQYQYQDDSVKLSLVFKDGRIPDSYTFRFEIATHNGCTLDFLTLDWPIDSTLFLLTHEDSISSYSLNPSGKNFNLCMKNYDTYCDFKLNSDFLLMPIDSIHFRNNE